MQRARANGPAILMVLAVIVLSFPAPTRAQNRIPGTASPGGAKSVANFSDLAKEAPASGLATNLFRPKPAHKPYVEHLPGPKRRVALSAPAAAPEAKLAASPNEAGLVQEVSAGPSPPTSSSFFALGETNALANPSPQGAVGPNHLMCATLQDVRIMSRSGAVLSTVGLDSFWASLGNPTTYDPRILYDSIGQRWIFISQADPAQPSSALLIAVSQTTDPTGAWNRYSIDADTNNGSNKIYLDAPTLGFNKDWIVVQANMFRTADDAATNSHIFVFNKTNLYAGGATARHTRIVLPYDAAGTNGFGQSQVPAATYDDTLDVIYLLKSWNGDNNGEGLLRVFYIGGPVGSEVFTWFMDDDGFDLYVQEETTWDVQPFNFADFAPQLGATNKISNNDARIQNVVYRDGLLFAAQTIFLPAGGLPTRSAIQWWAILPESSFQFQHGLIQDTNGASFFAFPSIAVNQNLDILIGYSRFGANQFASANYSLRVDGVDPFDVMRDPAVLKAGQAKYYKNYFGRNRWGDWSQAVVDPVNDNDLWTIQEYAASPTFGADRWGTWWGRIVPPYDLQLSQTLDPNPVPVGSSLTYTLSISNLLPTVVSDVIVTDTLPAGVTYVSATANQGSCTFSNGIVRCDLGQFSLDLTNLTVSIVVTPNSISTITNTATVSANGPDSNVANNSSTSVTSVGSANDLVLVMSDAPDPINPNATLTYTLLITNRGPANATGVIVSNTLPASVNFVSVASSQGTTGHSGSLVTANLGNMAIGAAASVSIVVTPTTGGDIVNSARVSANQIESTPADNSASVTTHVNGPPTVSDILNQTTLEDTPTAAIPFIVGDAESDPGILTLSGASSNPALVPNANIIFGGSGSNRTVTITPAPNQVGTATITVTVIDADNSSGNDTFVLTVNPVNDPPSFVKGANQTALEDAAGQTVAGWATGITPGPPDEAGQILDFIVSNDNPGLFSVQPAISPAGTLTYTPAPNASGLATVTVQLHDNGGGQDVSAPQTFTITIASVNDRPTLNAIPNPPAILEDAGAQTVNLNGITAGGGESQTLTVTAISSNPGIVPNPTVNYTSPNATGSLTYTPGAQANGSVVIAVVVRDSGGTANGGIDAVTNVFTVTITAINDAPTLNPIPNQNLPEDPGLQTINLSGVAAGPANEIGQALTVTATSSNPTFIPNPVVNYTAPNTTGTLTFTPALNTSGSATITVILHDNGGTANGGADSLTNSFLVTVTPRNHPPTLNPIANVSIIQGSGTQTVNFSGITPGPPNEIGQSLTVTAISSDPVFIPTPSVTYTSPNSAGSLSFTPAANASGTATIQVVVTDNGGTANSGINAVTNSFLVTVVDINDPPTINPLAPLTINEDAGPQTVNLSGITAGPPSEIAQTLIITATSDNLSVIPNPTVNYTSPNTTGALIFTSVTNASGGANITVIVTDNGGTGNGGINAVTNIFHVTVNPVNDAPIVSDITDKITNEDTPTPAIPFTISDVDNLASALILTAGSSNPTLVPNANISFSGSGSSRFVTIRPATNQFGATTITITAIDPLGAQGSDTFVLTVNPVNDLPTISAFAPQTTLEDIPTLPLPFTIGDVETPVGNLTLSGSSSNPELIVDSDITFGGSGSNRTVTVKPLTNQFGSATITVTVTDASNGQASASFELTVNPVNDPPFIVHVTAQFTDEDTPITVPFTIGDVETVAAALTMAANSSNTNLVSPAGITLGGSGPNRNVTLRPLTNQFGSTTITLTVSDGNGATNTDSFLLTVNPVNDLPSISHVADQTINEDSATAALAFTVSDLESAPVDLTVSGSSSNPALVPNSNILILGSGANRTVTVTPLPNQNGVATITLTVTDAAAGRASNTFVVNVTSINDLPTISDVTSKSTLEDMPTVAIPFTIGDVETPAGSLLVAASSSNQGLVPDANITLGGSGSNRTVTVTPALNRSGLTTITLTVTDGNNASASDVFTLTVVPVNDPPTLSDIPNQTINEEAPAPPLSFTVGDVESPVGSLLISGSSSSPALVPNANIVFGGSGTNRTVTVFPATNQFGSSTITVTVTDPDGASTSDTFVFTVIPRDRPPLLSITPDLSTPEDTALSIALAVTDRESPPGAVTLAAASSNPGLVPNANIVFGGNGANRTVTLTPATNQTGSTTITLTATDPGGSNTVSTFVLTVTAVNDPPTLNPINNLTINEDAGLQTVNLAGIGSGAPNESQPLALTATSSNPSLIPNPAITYTSPNATGTLTFTPAANASGTALLTVTVDDGQPQNNLLLRTFTVTVNPINDAPTLSDITDKTTSEDTPITIPFTVNDADTNTLSLILIGASTNTTLVPAANIVFGGNDSNRTVTITPAANQSGTTLVTISVTDGFATNSDTFLLTVNAVNDPPTLDAMTNVALTANAILQTNLLSGISSGAANEFQTLIVSATSGNTNVIPNPTVIYTSPAATGSIRYKPVTNAIGTAVLTVTVNDGQAASNLFSRSFTVFVRPATNAVPTISGLTNRTTLENVPTPALAFTIGDSVTPASLLTVSGVSSNQVLVPDANLVFGGSGSNRTLTISPVLNQSGTTFVTITVVDANFGAASLKFMLTVTPVNDLPTISSFAPQTIDEDTATGPIAFTVGDTETAPSSLIVSASSSNPTLVPNANIVLGGAGANRALIVTPAPNQSGLATISVVVSDGSGGSATNGFLLTVNPVNDPPTISDIADQTTSEDTPTAAISFTIGDPETAAGSLTLSGNSSNPALVPNANITFGGSGANRTVTLAPQTNQFGSATITVTVNDGTGGSASDTFVLTVVPVNDPPTLDPIGNVTLSGLGGSTNITVGGISSGAANENQVLTVTAFSSNPGLVSNPSVLYTTPNGTASLVFAPVINSNGVATITVTVNDGQSVNNLFSRSFNVSVVAVNDAPTLSDLADLSTPEDTATLAMPFRVGDKETPAVALLVTGASSNPGLVPPANIFFGGSGSNRTVTVLPATNQSGTATITVNVFDQNGGSASDSFQLTVTDVNDPPTISDVPNQSIDEDSSITLNFTVSDPETSAGSLTVTRASSNQSLLPNASVVLGGSGANRTVTLTPAANLSGNTTITLTVSDGNGASASDSFVLTVNPVNDPPTIAGIADQTINEDSATTPISFTIGDMDSPIDTLTVSGASSNPALVPNAGIVFYGNGTNRVFVITPLPNQFGTTVITATVTDGNGASSSTNFLFTVNPVNDPPTLNPIGNLAVNEDAGLQTVNLSGITSGPTNELQSLVVTAVSSNPSLIPNPTVNYSSPASTGTLTFTPVANANGAATITVTVQDNGGTANGGQNSVLRTFTVLVAAGNDPPVISNIADQTTPEDTAITVPFTVNDPDTGPVGLTLTASSSNTALVPNANIFFDGFSTNRAVTLIPATNQSGTATITVNVSDGFATNTDTFVLTVTAVNDRPTLNPLPDLQRVLISGTPPSDTISINGIGSGAPNESQTLVVTAVSSATTIITSPTVTYTSPATNGTMTFKQVKNASGVSVITVTVNDGQPSNNTITQSFSIFVRPTANASPTITGLSNQTINEDSNTGPLAFTVGDSTTAAASLTLSAASSNPALVPVGNVVFGGSGASRTVTVTPAPNRFGAANITVTVNDGNFGIASTNFLVTVLPVNDPPTLSAIGPQTIDEDTPSPPIPFTVGDLETRVDALTVTAASSNPALVPNGNLVLVGSGASRALVVTPATNQSGNTTITLVVNDGAGGTATNSFLLTVNPVNDLPTISDIPDQAINEDTATAALAFTVGDLETPAASLVPSGSSSNPALVPNANIVFGGGASNRTVTVTPAADQFGSATITVTITDGAGGFASDTFVLTVNPVNDLPTISNIADTATVEDTPTVAIPFTIGDLETPASNLILVGTSSDPGVVPNSGILFGGSGASRTVTVVPGLNQSGSATITVTVIDAAGGSASDTFVLTVNAANDAPTLDPIGNVTANVNSGPQTVILSGISAGAANESQTLTVTATSDTPTVVPNPLITYVSPGATGTLSFTPVPNVTGSSTITVTVQDNGGTANGGQNTLIRTFVITVSEASTPVLEIQRVDNNAIISWPVVAQGFHLEARNDFSSLTSWFNVTNVPGIIGSRQVVTNDCSNGQRFYRLKKP